MSFLELNGMTVKVRRGGEAEPEIIGNQRRMWSGELSEDRRIIKDRWTFESTRLSELDAAALKGLLQGKGHGWNFEWSDDARLVGDLFSTNKGLSPGSTIGSQRWGTSVDGEEVVDVNGTKETKFGNGSFTADVATTNLLAADARDMENDTASHNPINGASISVDTTWKLQGTQSLKVICSGGGLIEGVESPAVADTGGNPYTATVYVRAGSAVALSLRLIDDVGIITTVNFTTVANKWMRVSASGTTAGGATEVRWDVIEQNAADNPTFWVDAAQIEAGLVSTTWADGARAIGDFCVKRSGAFTDEGDMTVAFWARAPTANPAADVYFFAAEDDDDNTANTFNIRRGVGANNVIFRTNRGTGGVSSIIETGVWDGGWHHIACVMRRNPETGESKKTLYVDGVSVGTQDPAELPNFKKGTDMEFGHRMSTAFAGTEDTLIDDMRVVPYAMTADMVAALYNATAQLSLAPRLTMTGDVTPEIEVIVGGRVVDETYDPVSDAGTWRNNARLVSFELREV